MQFATVEDEFDVSRMQSDQIMIDFDYTHPRLGSEYIVIDINRTFLNHTYQVPGVYHPRLRWNDMPVDSTLVVAKTEGWVSFYHEEGQTERYWMDNMYKDLQYSGHLTLARDDLARVGRDTGIIYYTSHRNIRDFGISGDNFRLSAGFRNNLQTGGISCFDCRFIVMGENTNAIVEFVEHNCHRYSRVKFGEKQLRGDYYDLSALTFDPEEHHEMVMEVIDKHAVISLNGEVVYEMDYQSPAGNIKGLEAFFKGSGIVDHMSLEGTDNDLAGAFTWSGSWTTVPDDH